MVSRSANFERFGRVLTVVCFALALAAGCAHRRGVPLPPDGVLRIEEAGKPMPAGGEESAPGKAISKSEAKKAAAEEKARQRDAAQAAKEDARRAAAAQKKAAKEAQTAESARQKAESEARSPEASMASAEEAGTYVLQPGDEIDIQVYREPELSGAFRLNPSGEIRHSLAGAIPLAGMTIREAEADFTKRLGKDYLVNPRVIIKMVSAQSSQIVVLGEVKNPGVYPLPFGESTTLLQAIANAGGFTDLASRDRVQIVRRSAKGGEPSTIRVRVSDLLGGKGKQQDVSLEPNDVINVPEVVF